MKARASKAGVTFVEVMIAVLFFAILSYFLHTLLALSARRNMAGDKKNQTVRAAFDVMGRLRRDLRWAVKVSVSDKGRRLELTGPGGNTRSWSWDATTLRLQVPRIGSPGTSVPYRLGLFKTVRFWRVPGTTLLKYLLSVLPADANPQALSSNDLKYATTFAGEVGNRRAQGMGHFPEWNWGAECLN